MPPEPRLFAVIRSHGAAWRDSLPLEEQEAWKPHASFMDGLASEGFVVLGGPLEGTPDVLLIVRAGSADEVVNRLSEDPWTALDLLRTSKVTAWTLRLGSLE